MAESKSAALPLGYAPTARVTGTVESTGYLRFPFAPPVYREKTSISTASARKFALRGRGLCGSLMSAPHPRRLGLPVTTLPAIEASAVSWEYGVNEVSGSTP